MAQTPGRTTESTLPAEIARRLMAANSVLSMAHPFADGDAIGSQLALHHFCLAHGKTSTVLNFDPIPEPLQWLPGLRDAVGTLNHHDSFDLFFLMETTDRSRMGDRMKLLPHARYSIHIDHHPGVDGLGDLNYHDEKASSTCEMLYEVLQLTGRPLSRETLTCLYVGLITDTGNFRFTNTTPRAHTIAGEIIQQGIDIAGLFKKVYEANPFSKVLIHGLVMSRTRLVQDFPISYSWLKDQDFQDLNATAVDSDGAINHLCTISGVEVAAMFREQGSGDIKISLRSNGQVNVQAVCKQLGGGGHRQAAGAQMSGSLENAIATTIALLKTECSHLGLVNADQTLSAVG
jgi:phosphoesterase RecJ-like protein